jgi:hypothetical protein
MANYFSKNSIYKYTFITLATFKFFMLPMWGASQEWRTLIATGPAERRLDIALIAVDYSERQTTLAEKRAQTVLAGLLEAEPFINYKNYINFHFRLLPAEASQMMAVNLDFKNILTCNFEQAITEAQSAPDADIIMVLSNTPTGRSTAYGKVITLAAKGSIDDVFIHEMGHAFGDLADEYEDAFMSTQRERSQAEQTANTTLEPNVALSKWHYWINTKWNGPHMNMDLPKGHRITHKEGAYYFTKDVYRPETTCKMRDHRSKQFCVVCAEEIEKQFFVHIDPIQNYWPQVETLKVWADEGVRAGATIIDVKASGGKIGKFVTTWYLDGQRIPGSNSKKNTEVNIHPRQLSQRKHELALRVDFVNGNVRKDHGWLSSSITWNIVVNEYPEPIFLFPKNIRSTGTTPVEISNFVKGEVPSNLKIQWQGLPEGAQRNGLNWTWQIPNDQYGAWLISCIGELGGQVKKQNIVVSHARNVNKMPAANIPEAFELNPGQTWTWQYSDIDPDGDHIAMEVENMPDGMEYDPLFRMLKWNPPSTFTNGTLNINIFDGTGRFSRIMNLSLSNYTRSEQEKNEDEIAFRSHIPQTRLKAMSILKNKSVSAGILHCNRLLRDKESIIANQACRYLEYILSKNKNYIQMFFEDIEPYLWDLCDQPKILDWVKGLAENNDSSSRKVLSTIANIEAYNKKRGAWKP